MTKKKAIIGAAAVVAAIAIIVLVVNAVSKVDYWDLKAGKKTVAVFATEEEAEAVISAVEGFYVKKGAEVRKLEIEPVLSEKNSTKTGGKTERNGRLSAEG